MNNHFKQLIRAAKGIKLSDADRQLMRAHFTNLLGVENTAQKNAWALFFTTHRVAATSLGMAAAVLMVTGGVAAAAESSAPGDALYPLKINVTEEIRSKMTRSPEAKAAWETKRMERRLSEAEHMIKNTANAAALTVLERNITTHSERVQRSIDTLERSGNVEAAAVASSDVVVPLKAHKAILREMAKAEQHATTLLKKVEREEERLQDRRKKLEAQVDGNTNTDKPFSERERSRRQSREGELLRKAAIELNVMVRPDDSDDARANPPNSGR